LVNLRPESVQHEFVNAPLSHANRTQFTVDCAGFEEGGNLNWQGWFIEMLRDWGTNLEICLYEEALTHCLGGEAKILQPVEVLAGSRSVTRQLFRLITPDTAFKITAFPELQRNYQSQLERMLHRTKLARMQWINVSRKCVTFKTLKYFPKDFS
jgi:hypothetical protein